jgi:4-hydroxymandelate oxidase
MTAFVTIDDLEAEARLRLTRMAYDYFRAGADDEVALRRNREAWSKHEIAYRVLVDVAAPRTETTLLGVQVPHPIHVAPTAYHKLAHPEAERASAEGAADAGSLYVTSTLSTTRMEDVAAVAPASPKWFQLYVHRDRDLTARLVARAKEAGYGAIVLTVDTPVLGRRIPDVRNGFSLPEGMNLANLMDDLPPEVLLGPGSELARYVASRHDASLTWLDVKSLADLAAPLPLVVKGIVRADDALRAIDHGARAVWVSNHGGRQLDLAPSSARALTEVARAVGGRAEVYVDGGIYSGAHALVALGLGARAVFVGRPVLWGLAAGGREGVAGALATLVGELVRAMQLAGCADLAAAADVVRLHAA